VGEDIITVIIVVVVIVLVVVIFLLTGLFSKDHSRLFQIRTFGDR